jgi:hypothetical protein
MLRVYSKTRPHGPRAQHACAVHTARDAISLHTARGASEALVCASPKVQSVRDMITRTGFCNVPQTGGLELLSEGSCGGTSSGPYA